MSAAFITGASRGIGLAVAIGLAQDGYDLALVSRSEKDLEGAKQEILNASPKTKIITLALDVAKRDAVFSAFKSAVTALGTIDVVFNNAGVFIGGTTELTEEAMQKLFGVNVFGALWVAQAAVEHFRTNKKGYLINVTSVRGVEAAAGIGGYSASKFALRAFNESLFLELIPEGIKVTAIGPSWVATKMTSGADLEQSEMIQSVDIYKTVKYLLSLSPKACPREVVVECTSDIE